MLWHGLPPEVNTGRLITGAGAEPFLQAEIAWQTLATDFTAAMTALRAQVAAVAALWQGMASSTAQAAFEPYMAWMASVIAMAQQRALAAGAQAASYSTAVATTPTLAEIAGNHLTRAVLHATNFFGVNTIPIAEKEFEYFVVLWNRAAGAMDSYSAATGVNTTFPPFPPAPPIMAAPGAPHAGLAAVLTNTAAALPASMARNAILTQLAGFSTAGAVKGRAQATGQVAAMAGQRAAGVAQQGALRGSDAASSGPAQSSQMASQMAQMAAQAPQMAAQLPQQAGQLFGQGPQQLMSMAGQPLQQLTSLFSQGAGTELAGQNIAPDELMGHFGSTEAMGMYGTSAAGSAGGGFGGAGLLSAASAGSTPLRSPAGWTAPMAAASGAEGAAIRTATAGSGPSAMGSGTGMMAPLAGAGALARGDGAAVAVSTPEVDEEQVVRTLGFEVVDDESDSPW